MTWTAATTTELQQRSEDSRRPGRTRCAVECHVVVRHLELSNLTLTTPTETAEQAGLGERSTALRQPDKIYD